jgi:hypothetical protein
MAGRNSCDPEMGRRDPLSNYNPFPTSVKSVLNIIYSIGGLLRTIFVLKPTITHYSP